MKTMEYNFENRQEKRGYPTITIRLLLHSNQRSLRDACKRINPKFADKRYPYHGALHIHGIENTNYTLQLVNDGRVRCFLQHEIAHLILHLRDRFPKRLSLAREEYLCDLAADLQTYIMGLIEEKRTA